MNYDLSEFDRLVEEGYIRKVEKGPLVLYNYTDKCTYDKHWNEYTLAARGIIFEKDTGRLIAKPFPKFFNLGETTETFLTNLPNEPYVVTEKVDGSLGIIYYYDGRWNVATRGSFDSEQAVKATEMLYSLYDTNNMNTELTYLVEIIYPDNKIVVNYGMNESLILLGTYLGEKEVFDRYWQGEEAAQYEYTFEQMIEFQKTMPKDEEGFVVRFTNGLRVKIKGHEYLRIHKMISCMSPLSFWESMVDGVVSRDYVVQLPEEFRSEFEPMIEHLEFQYKRVRLEIEEDYNSLPSKSTDKDNLKQVGLLTQGANSLYHPGAVFSRLLDKSKALDKYIMKCIRPTGNVLGG